MKKQKHEEYRGHRTPGILLLEEVLPAMKAVSSEQELPVLYAYHMFDKAHLVMLAEESLIPREDAVSMLLALRAMEKEEIEKVRLAVGGGMHSGEYYLIRRLGEDVGGRIHLARSSADLGAVAVRVKLRDQFLQLMEGLNKVRDATLEVAAQHVDTVMPGYIHGVHGQPLTLCHELLLWANLWKRDFERLEETYCRINMSPAGAVVLTGSDFAVNRHRVAELLGFDGVLRNAFDACVSRDYLLEAYSVLAILHHNMARWADDILLWRTDEFGMIDIPDRFYGTSSIMAQMKSPYTMENIKGAAACTIGGLMSAFFSEKGPTGVPILEHYYTKESLYTSIDYAVRDLGWMAMLLPEIKANKELMRERAGTFWAQAADVAGALVRDKGLPWRTAHQIVGILVRVSRQRGINPCDVDPKLLDEAAVEYMGEPVGLGEESLRKALDPAESVRRRTLYGGPAPEEAMKQIAELEEQLRGDRETVASMHGHLKVASEKLERTIDLIIGDHSPAG